MSEAAKTKPISVGREAETPARVAGEAVSSPSWPRVVYLVDDDEAVRDSLKALLEACGLAVKDYPSAAEFLSESHDFSQTCLLVDVHMPGMTGWELLGVLQRRESSPVSIVITGAGDEALKGRLTGAGAYAVLDKPIHDDLLLRTIARAFEARA